MTAAAESAGNGRDAAGRFVPGHRLGGRPRGVDLRALVDERAASDPTIGSTDDLLWNVVVVLARRAATGDVQAARLLLDRLAAPPDEPSAVGATMTDREAAERLAIILRDAAARRAPWVSTDWLIEHAKRRGQAVKYNHVRNLLVRPQANHRGKPGMGFDPVREDRGRGYLMPMPKDGRSSLALARLAWDCTRFRGDWAEDGGDEEWAQLKLETRSF